MTAQGLELLEGAPFTRFSEFVNPSEEFGTTLVIQRDSHCVRVNIETDERYNRTVYLLPLFVWDSQLIPEHQESTLIGGEVALVRVVILDMFCAAKRTVVVNVNSQIRDQFDMFRDPPNK